MFHSFVNSETKFSFPDGLKNKDKNWYPRGTSEAMKRIKFLLEKSYGATTGDKIYPTNLEKLVTQAYLPYLEQCCKLSNPLKLPMPLVYKLPSDIRIAHGGIQKNTIGVNHELNDLYYSFIQQLSKKPYTHDELKKAGLIGTFYTDDDKDSLETDHTSIWRMARQIKLFTKLADSSAAEAVQELCKEPKENYKGPIWSRFYELTNNLPTDKLIGICGHSPLGQLPMVYQNNLCCDTTYAAGSPDKRPAMHIEAHLESTTKWEIKVTLKEPVNMSNNEITQYTIRHDTMQIGSNEGTIHKHYVGHTDDNKSIWRVVNSTIKPTDAKFWIGRITPFEYVLEDADSIQKTTVSGKKYTIISDIEGNRRFLEESLALEEESLALEGKQKNTLVLLGDTWDRGSTDDELCIWDRIKAESNAFPNQKETKSENEQREVIMVVGNRDANKVRWICELYNDFEILE